MVLLRVTVRHFELARPGVQPLRLNGQLVTGAEREELLEQAGAAVIDDPAGEKARQAVADVCSPYRHQDDGGEWADEVAALNADRPGGDLTPISGLEGVPGGSRLAAPAGWGGPWGWPLPRGAGRSRSRCPPALPRWMTRSGWT